MAYGARLESVLGSRPRGFESRILRLFTPTSAACCASLTQKRPPVSVSVWARVARGPTLRSGTQPARVRLRAMRAVDSVGCGWLRHAPYTRPFDRSDHRRLRRHR